MAIKYVVQHVITYNGKMEKISDDFVLYNFDVMDNMVFVTDDKEFINILLNSCNPSTDVEVERYIRIEDMNGAFVDLFTENGYYISGFESITSTRISILEN